MSVIQRVKVRIKEEGHLGNKENVMNLIKGKRWGIIGNAISLIFSIISISITHTAIEIIEEEIALNPHKKDELNLFLSYVDGFAITTYIILAMGLMGIVIAYRIKNENQEKVRRMFLMSALVHLIGLRIVSFIILLGASLKLRDQN